MVYNFNFENNYDDLIFQCGIYKIYYSTTPDKVYVGSALKKQTGKYKKSSGFWHRFRTHCTRLINNNHHSIKLQNAYNKHGKEYFCFEIIETCTDLACIDREQFWIDYYDSYNTGYNCAPKAGSMLGYNHTKKSKDKMIQTHKNIRYEYLSDILNLYKTKKSIKQIGKTLQISHHTVSKILKENNYDIHPCISRCKVTYQYDAKTGKLINEFISTAECARFLKTTSSKVVSVLSGRCLTHKGFHFNYKKLSPEEVVQIVNYRKPKKKRTGDYIENCRKRALGNTIRRTRNILQLSVDGELVKEWKDSKEIVNFYGLRNFSPVLRVIKKHRNTYKGFVWKLKN